MNAVCDDEIQDALALYGRVQASPELRRLVLDGDPAARAITTRRVAGVVVVAAAAALVVGAVVLDDPAPDVEAGRRALDLSSTEQVVFSDGETVAVDDLFNSADLERMRDVFADHGAELVVRDKPVTAARDGQVLSVSIPAGMAEEGSRSGIITLVPGGTIEVTVGRVSAAPELTLFEAFPEIPGAINFEDPVATGEALEALGFTVHWVHITAPGVGADVTSPPPGTRVLSVLGPHGEWDGVDPATDTLMVEVATPEAIASLG